MSHLIHLMLDPDYIVQCEGFVKNIKTKSDAVSWWGWVGIVTFLFLMQGFLCSCSCVFVFFSTCMLQHAVSTYKTRLNIEKKNISNSLWRPHEEKSTQTVFQGGSPWATLIFNSMFVVAVFSWHLLLDFYGVPIGFLWNIKGMSMGFPRESYRISMEFLW